MCGKPWSPPFESHTHTVNNLVYGSTCCAHDNGTRNVVSIDHIAHTLLSRPCPLYLYYTHSNRCFARLERKRGREARGAPFQHLFVSTSESNSVYKKAAEGVIPAKCTLVCGYSRVRVIIVQLIQKLLCMLNIALAGNFDLPTQYNKCVKHSLECRS